MKPFRQEVPRAVLAAVLALSLSVPRVARAEASSDDPQGKLEAAPKQPKAPQQTWKRDGTWGWFLVASSVFVGGAITSVGLTVSCDDATNQESCKLRSSILVWGGIGAGALGSVLGLAAVAAGRDRLAAKPAALTFKPASRVCRADPLALPLPVD